MLNDTISQPTLHGSVLSEPGKSLESRSRLLQLTSFIVTISHFVRVAGCQFMEYYVRQPQRVTSGRITHLQLLHTISKPQTLNNLSVVETLVAENQVNICWLSSTHKTINNKHNQAKRVNNYQHISLFTFHLFIAEKNRLLASGFHETYSVQN